VLTNSEPLDFGGNPDHVTLLGLRLRLAGAKADPQTTPRGVDCVTEHFLGAGASPGFFIGAKTEWPKMEAECRERAWGFGGGGSKVFHYFQHLRWPLLTL